MAAERQQIKEERNKKMQFEKRKSTILKSGKELSILCDVNVCVVIVSPDGKLETWPEILDDAKAVFREAAASNKRPRSDNNRKRRNPDGDGKKTNSNKKMKEAVSGDSCHVIGNNNNKNNDLAEEEDAGVLVIGKKTEEDQLSYNCTSGNPGFPIFEEWKNRSTAGIPGDYYSSNSYPAGNYENQILHHQGCSSSCAALMYGSGSEFLGDPCCSSSSGGSYGGGDYNYYYSGHDDNQIVRYDDGGDLDHHQWNDCGSAAGAAMFDPLCVLPLQSMWNQTLGGDFQFGNYYQYE